ncbi:MAG TPA: phosphatase PAP2 family protein [Gemmatimonadaceae bacterium]|nr:phosphatase PAP2 family protein [Gemmatimonadaceae bacterium]
MIVSHLSLGVPGRALLAVALLSALVAVVLAAWHHFTALARALWKRGERVRRGMLSSAPAQRLRTRYPRAWRFVAARFAPGEYLGVHLTLGLLLAGAALLLFAAITENVVERESLAQFDLRLAGAFHASTTRSGARIFGIVTEMGSGEAILLVGIIVAGVLIVRRRGYLLAGWTAALVGAWVLNALLKVLVRRERPAFANQWVTVHSFSFPSGHAMSSLVTYGMLAYVAVLALHNRHARNVVLVFTTVLVLAIGLSRLYLGVHYFSDVIGGYAGGVVWLAACISGTEIARRHARERSR